MGRSHSWLIGGTLIALSVVPLGCGDSEEQSLCEVYTEFLAARANVQGLEPTDLTAAAAADVADDYLSTVQRLRETDTSNDAAVDDLEMWTQDLLRTLESVEDDADYATWAPLVEDTLEDVSKAADRVEELLKPQCEPEIES